MVDIILLIIWLVCGGVWSSLTLSATDMEKFNITKTCVLIFIIGIEFLGGPFGIIAGVFGYFSKKDSILNTCM
jgi:hypothetical protein